jgi:hypothetical protein
MTFHPRFSLIALLAAVLQPMLGAADVIGFGEMGISAFLSNSKNASGINYYGFACTMGLRAEKHPRYNIHVETGWFYGDNARSTRIGKNLYHDSGSTLIPLLAGFDYIQPLGGRTRLYAGPVAGLFIGMDYARKYEPNAYYENGEWHDRVKEYHLRSHIFWGAGGEAGFMIYIGDDKEDAFNLRYRYLCASSYKVFDTETGTSRNQQITIAFNHSF